MIETVSMQIIAHICSEFPTKFGIPRQSGLVEGLRAAVVFEPEFRNPDALRGLEGFSHVWLLWQFHQAKREGWSPTVRPPRLGGNERVGVFASRSPFRPNGLGLSAVRLEGIVRHPKLGPVLQVSGADLMDGTPILDIKPYLPDGDCHPEASGGYTTQRRWEMLEVNIPLQWLSRVPENRREALAGVLALDPRPSYQEDANRVYGMEFAGLNVRFSVRDQVLTVCGIEELEGEWSDGAALL